MIVIVLFLLALGAGLGWAFDMLVLQRNRTFNVEGHGLSKALKKSSVYEDIRNGKKVHSSRLRSGSPDSGGPVAIDRDRGHGTKILQLDARRDVRRN